MINLEKKHISFLDETVYTATHESGVKIIIIPKSGYGKKYAMFATKYGSCDTEFEKDGKIIKIPDGTAHFLEHKMFDMPDGIDAFGKFSKFGANANAFTSFAVTAYHFSSTENFTDALENLVTFVQTPQFSEKSVHKEQGIIGQEIKMYDDDPHWRVFFNCLEAMYQNNSVKIDIAGTTESISTITEQVLYDIYSVFYHPSNMILFVAGDVCETEIAACLDKFLKKDTKECKITRRYPQEPDEINVHFTTQKLDVAVPLFAIGFKDNENHKTGRDMLKKEIIMQILSGMLFSKYSPIYKNLYEEGLINESFTCEYSLSDIYAYTVVDGEAKEPRKVYERVMEFLSNMTLSKEDYEVAKRSVWGGYIRMFNSTEALGYNITIGALNGIDYFEYKDIYDSVTFEDAENVFKKHFTKENSVLSVVEPVK